MTMDKIEIGGRTYSLVEDESNDDQPEGMTKEEKISEFARSRARDRHGRFLGKRDDVDAFFYTPYRVVWRPNPRKRWVLERREVLYWHQRVAYAATMIGFGSAVVVLFGRAIIEGIRLWLR